MPFKFAHGNNKTASEGPGFFYKVDEIKYKGLATSSYKKLPRQQYIF